MTQAELEAVLAGIADAAPAVGGCVKSFTRPETPPSVKVQRLSAKMRALKSLYDQGQITTQLYEATRIKVLNEFDD